MEVLPMVQKEKIIRCFILIVCVFTFMPHTSSAVERAGDLDIYLSTGYGIPIGGFFIDSSETYRNVSDITPSSTEDHYLNYGHGLKIYAGVSYHISNNLGMRFGFNYTAGLPSNKVEYDSPSEKYTEKYKRNLFGLQLMILPRFEALGLFDMYAGAGIGFHFTSLTITKDNTSSEGEIRTSPALSFHGVLGTDFPLNDKFTLFSEVSFDQMSFNTKSRKDPDGVAQEDFNRDSNSSPHPIKIPGTNVGLSIGLRLTLFRLEKSPGVY